MKALPLPLLSIPADLSHTVNSQHSGDPPPRPEPRWPCVIIPTSDVMESTSKSSRSWECLQVNTAGAGSAVDACAARGVTQRVCVQAMYTISY